MPTHRRAFTLLAGGGLNGTLESVGDTALRLAAMEGCSADARSHSSGKRLTWKRRHGRALFLLLYYSQA